MEARRRQYPPGLRKRAVRLMTESQADHRPGWAAINSIAARLGVATAETGRKWRKWVHRAEIDGGVRPGVSREESAEPPPPESAAAASVLIEPSFATVPALGLQSFREGRPYIAPGEAAAEAALPDIAAALPGSDPDRLPHDR